MGIRTYPQAGEPVIPHVWGDRLPPRPL